MVTKVNKVIPTAQPQNISLFVPNPKALLTQNILSPCKLQRSFFCQVVKWLDNHHFRQKKKILNLNFDFYI
jgi:hypothetical protein